MDFISRVNKAISSVKEEQLVENNTSSTSIKDVNDDQLEIMIEDLEDDYSDEDYIFFDEDDDTFAYECDDVSETLKEKISKKTQDFSRFETFESGIYDENEQMIYSWDELVKNGYIKLQEDSVDIDLWVKNIHMLVVDKAVKNIRELYVPFLDILVLPVHIGINNVLHHLSPISEVMSVYMSQSMFIKIKHKLINYCIHCITEHNEYNGYLEDNILYKKNTKKEIVRVSQSVQGIFNIPDTVEIIGGYAFYNCEYLTEINIPTSVKKIGANAFSGCTNLHYLYIPSSIVVIGENAFKNVKNVIYNGPALPWGAKTGNFAQDITPKMITEIENLKNENEQLKQKLAVFDKFMFYNENIESKLEKSLEAYNKNIIRISENSEKLVNHIKAQYLNQTGSYLITSREEKLDLLAGVRGDRKYVHDFIYDTDSEVVKEAVKLCRKLTDEECEQLLSLENASDFFETIVNKNTNYHAYFLNKTSKEYEQIQDYIIKKYFSIDLIESKTSYVRKKAIELTKKLKKCIVGIQQLPKYEYDNAYYFTVEKYCKMIHNCSIDKCLISNCSEKMNRKADISECIDSLAHCGYIEKRSGSIYITHAGRQFLDETGE